MRGRKTKECSRTVAVRLVVVCSVVCLAVLLCWKGGGVAQVQGVAQCAGCRAGRRASCRVPCRAQSVVQGAGRGAGRRARRRAQGVAQGKHLDLARRRAQGKHLDLEHLALAEYRASEGNGEMSLVK
jgi:hypothetical protein